MSVAPSDDYIVRKVLGSHLLVTVLVTLSATLSIVINSLVVGNLLGSDALAVFGLSSPVLILFSAIAGIFGNGGTFICARHLSSGDVRAIRNNFTVTMIASFAVGLALTVVLVIAAPVLADILGEGGDLESMAEGYLACLGLSVIPMLLSQNMLLYVRMDGGQKLALLAIIATIIVDAAVAVFSASSGIGISGVGLAVGVSSGVGALICALHFRKKDRKIGFCPPTDVGAEIRSIVSAGLPTAINRGSQTLKNLVLNAFLLGTVGTVAVVSLSVQTSIYQFTIAICTGYGIMVATMCGMFYGERDKRSMESTLRVCIRSGLVVSTAVAIPGAILSGQIASLFIEDGGDLDSATQAGRLFMLSLPTSTVCMVLLYMYQTLGNLMLSNAISLTRGFFYVVLFSIFLFPVIGVEAVWLSFLAADILSILTIIAMIRIKTGSFPHSYGDFIIVPRGFDGVEEICSISVGNDMREVIELSRSIDGMCLEKGVDRDRASKVALCIEEMAGNVVRYAFSDGKRHYIDIRVLMQGDDLIFRMRDDGMAFNPLLEDSDDHYGIRVVRAAAKDIGYSNSSGLNILTVVV